MVDLAFTEKLVTALNEIKKAHAEKMFDEAGAAIRTAHDLLRKGLLEDKLTEEIFNYFVSYLEGWSLQVIRNQ